MSIPPLEPWDEENRRLVSHVRPPDWVNPEPAARYQLLVVGAGTAGLVTAAGAAGLGAKVALIERQLMGGDCLNVGCVPSKALIRSARAWADVREAGRYGVLVPAGARVDFPRVMERMRRLRAELSLNDSVRRFQGMGVDVFLGEGRFVSGEALEVGGRRLLFSKAVIATGARASAPPVEGLGEAGFLTNESVFSLTELPKRLAVIGAGPIGCEFAQAFARFGSRVSVLEVASQILIREDPEAARRIARALEHDGVEVILDCRILRAQGRGAEKVLTYEARGRRQEMICDAILVGAGRAPNVDGLGLEAAGVEYDRLGVKVDDCLQTSNPRIYAAGDICSSLKFTHAADAMARIAIQNALFLGRRRASSLVIPWCTYTDPEIAHVGLYEKEAVERGLAVDTFTQELSQVDRAALDGEEEGFLKVHVRRGTDRLLGATLVSRHAGETISELVLALTAGLGLKVLSGVIHPYPTQAEAVKKAADAYSRTRLTPLVRRLLAVVLRLSS